MAVHLTTTRTDRLEPGAVLDAEGRSVEVVAARPHQRRWLVFFAGVEDRPQAEALRGAVLRAEAVVHEGDDDGLWVHELVGAAVVDTTGAVLGDVEAVQANPASDLLVLAGGVLIPLTFVVDHEPGRLVVDPPEGLLDL